MELPVYHLVKIITVVIVLAAIVGLLYLTQAPTKGLETDENIKLCCSIYKARGCPDPSADQITCQNDEDMDVLRNKAGLTACQLNLTCGCAPIPSCRP